MCPVGLWTVSSLNISRWSRLWAPDSFGRLAKCHHFPFLHLWILASSKDTNRVCEYRHSICHVCCDAVGTPCVIPLRSALTPGQPLPKCSPVRICVFSLKVTGGSAHLHHAQLCLAGVCPVALPAAEDEGICPNAVYWGVCWSVHWRCGWSGIPVNRRGGTLSHGARECYIAVSPAASQAAKTQGQHPWTMGWGWDSRGPQPLPSLMDRAKNCTWKIHLYQFTVIQQCYVGTRIFFTVLAATVFRCWPQTWYECCQMMCNVVWHYGIHSNALHQLISVILKLIFVIFHVLRLCTLCYCIGWTGALCST